VLIDAHAHVIPGSFPSAPAGCDPADWSAMEPADDSARVLASGPMRFTARSVWFDAERRLAASAASGVDAEVVSPFPPLLNYRLPAGPGRDLARAVNEYVASLCAAYPGRFYGLGTVPLQDPDLAAGELEDVAKAGLAGVEIASHVGGVSLADERFGGFFAEAERLGTAIFVHAMPAPSDRLPGPATATFGVGVEGSLAAAAITTGGVAQTYPGLRLAFSHAAGGFPLMLTRAQWFWGRTWNEEPPGERGPEAAPWAAETGPAELARRFYYDSLVFDRRAIRYLVEMLGADRLLVGSDFPAMPREEPAGRTLRSMGLPEGVLDDITWHNCFRFLGIDAPKLFSSREPHGHR
jgi:aminocarboxymuconate-semialdehyde decarboxylase